MVGFSKRSLVIEFFGLPGSGKSYAALRVCSALRDRGVRVIMPIATITRAPLPIRIPIKSVLAFLFAVLHLPTAFRVMHGVRESRQRSLHDAVSVAFNVFFVLGVLRRYQHRRVVLVFDQGTVQAVVSVLYSARSRPPERLVSVLPPPDVLLHMTADHATIVDRLRSRTVRQSRVESDVLSGIMRTQRRVRLIERSDWYAGVRCVIPLQGDLDEGHTGRAIETVTERILCEWRNVRRRQNLGANEADCVG